MEFRLTYEGPLKATTRSNGRVADKHYIRQQLHKQLAAYWAVQKPLNALAAHLPHPEGRPFVERLAGKYARCGFRFMPLISDEFKLVCALDILFLRRESSGQLIVGGDLDNRIKTLFDALKMPENCDEVQGCAPGADENPFYCLLERDDRITDFRVTTDRLLAPLKDQQHPNEVYLVIKVNTQLTDTEGLFSSELSML